MRHQTAAYVLLLAFALCATFQHRPARCAEPVFISPGWIAGKATLHSKTNANSWQLSSGPFFGHLARVTNSSSVNLAESDASVRFNNSPGLSTKWIEFSTKAVARDPYRDASALLHTTPYGANTGPGYVDVLIKPSSRGETNGKRVQVTLTASYRNHNINAATGYNFAQVSYQGGDLIKLKDTKLTPGGKTYSKSATFSSTIGAKLRIGVVGYSFAPQNSAVSGTTRIDLTIR